MSGELEVDDPAERLIARECVDLRERINDVRARVERLRGLADHLEQTANEDEHALGELEGALGLAAQLQIEDLDHELGGKRLREIAIEVLARELRPGQAVHYRDWYGLLLAAGYRARGKDPLASFLAQINRADGVEAIGGRSGRYRLCAA